MSELRESLKANANDKGVELATIKSNEAAENESSPGSFVGNKTTLRSYHSDDSDEDDDSFSARFETMARHTIKNNWFNSMMVLCFVVALFGHDFFNVMDIPDDPWNVLLDAIMCVTTVIFVVEMIFYWVGEHFEYAWTLLWIVDCLSIFSMAFEISFIWGCAGRTEKMGDEASVKLARTTRAAKVGARAFRFLKLLKVLNCIDRGERREHGQIDWQKKALSRNMRSTLGNKIAVLTIIMVVCLPFIEVEQWTGQDTSILVWCERLEANWLRAYHALKKDESLEVADDFEGAIKDMDVFYSNHVAHPYKVTGFPDEIELNGKTRKIPGQRYLEKNQPPPPRLEFVCEYELKVDDVDVASGNVAKDDLKVFIYVNNMTVTKLRAIENVCMVAFVLITVLWSSRDLQKTLEPLLDVEKQAEYAKILLKNNIVEEDEMADLSLESKGVIQEMMNLGPKKRRTYKEHNKSFKIHDKVVINLPAEEEVINSWDLNLLNLDPNQCNQLALYIFFDSEMSRNSGRLFTNVGQFQKFYDAVSKRYLDVPYHNFVHALDVMHTTFRMMCEVLSTKWSTDVEHYSLLLSAICHDVGHPGTTNAFCVETEHEFALRYNDASPLENHHCATMFEVCRMEETKMFDTMAPENKKLARKVCIAVILHTDLVHHFQMIKDLDLAYEGENKKVCDTQAKTPLQFSPEFEEVIQKNHMMLLEFVLHQSDISNPLKPFETGKMWAWKVMEEFFAQGDEEKRLGIPVGMLNDRNKINRYGSQHGFITFLVSPLILSATRIFQTLMPLDLNMAANLWEWHRQWQADANPPETDAAKRSVEVNKIDDKIRELERRCMTEEELAKANRAAGRNKYKGVQSMRTDRSRSVYTSERSRGADP